jgi:membrane protein implicated in regulation of membrane protease activity
MWLLYLMALVLGGGSLLVQLLSGGDHAHDHDFSGPDHPDGPGLLSTRALVYGLFTFGFVGILLHVPGLAEPRTALVVAASSALAAALAVGYVFRTLGDAAASGAATIDEARGREGRVLVSCGKGRLGKVRVGLKGHTVDVLATTDAEHIAAGALVTIVDVKDGVAHVAAADGVKGTA